MIKEYENMAAIMRDIRPSGNAEDMIAWNILIKDQIRWFANDPGFNAKRYIKDCNK